MSLKTAKIEYLALITKSVHGPPKNFSIARYSVVSPPSPFSLCQLPFTGPSCNSSDL